MPRLAGRCVGAALDAPYIDLDWNGSGRVVVLVESHGEVRRASLTVRPSDGMMDVV
jgi:hypothetical protein